MTEEKNTGTEHDVPEDGQKEAETVDATLVDETSTEDLYRSEAPKKPLALYIIIAILIIGMGILGYMLFLKERPQQDSVAQVKQMQEVAQQIQTLEDGVKKNQDEMIGLMDQYKEKKGEPMGFNPLELNDAERKLLEQKIKDEKDVSVKSLLEEINDRNKDIDDMKKKIVKLEGMLPKPHIVQKGETHYQVAMDFLMTEKKVEKDKALKLVKRTALFDELVPGFKVWNFYTGEAYGSSVTQGTAAVSPNTIIRKAKKKLVDARDEAIDRGDKLAKDVEELEAKKAKIIGQLEVLATEKSNLISQISDLSQQNQKMQVTVNSLFYLLDLQKSLKKRGILKGGFLKSTKLKDVSPEHFSSSFDLREQDDLNISAEELGIKKIKKVIVYPKFYKKDVDFSVEISEDKKNARLIIKDKAKFKNERVVISIK